MRTFAGLNLFCVMLVFIIQGCSTTASTVTPRPIIEKGSPAPVAGDIPSPVVPGGGQIISRQPSAVIALLDTAEKQANDGDLESSAASLERAIRINPGNAVLWHHLATVRLAQGDALQAEQLAVKSNSLAPGNAAQQVRNWKLIAKARRQRGELKGAGIAEQRANELEQR